MNDEDKTISREATAEDLESYPTLVDQGVKVGDMVNFPDTSNENQDASGLEDTRVQPSAQNQQAGQDTSQPGGGEGSETGQESGVEDTGAKGNPFKTELGKDNKTNKQVMVDQGQLDAILKRLAGLEQAIPDGRPQAVPVKERDYRFRIIDDKYCIGYDLKKGAYTERKNTKLNPEDKPRLFMDVYLLDLETYDESKDPFKQAKKVSLDFNHQVGNAREARLKLVSKEVKEMFRDQGEVEIKEVKDFDMIGTGVNVPMREIWTEAKYTLEFPGGKKITLDERFLNI